MTENEAINELQANIDLPFGFTVSDEVSEMAIQALEEIQQYRAIGTIDEFKALKEKNTPKKPRQVSKAMDKDEYVGLIGRCPNCGSIVAEDNLVCEDCFQVLDWSE